MNTDRFDDAIRARHAESLEHLSPRVRAQLAQRRRAALAGQAPRVSRSPWRFAFPLAAVAAVGALAIGLQSNTQWRAPDAPAPMVATVKPSPASDALASRTPAPRATALPDTDEATASASLEENPDLYVWLASDDAADLMAMETSR